MASGLGQVGTPDKLLQLCRQAPAALPVTFSLYLFRSSVHSRPLSSSLDSCRHRPWAGSPEAVSSTCVVSKLVVCSMARPWASGEDRGEWEAFSGVKQLLGPLNQPEGLGPGPGPIP